MREELNRRLPDPFSKDYSSNEAVVNRKIAKIQKIIRYFATLFVMAMILLVLYQVANQAPSFRQQLEQKEEVYLTVKPPRFNAADIPEEKEEASIEKADRVYYTKFFQIGSLKYRAAIAYWDINDVPRGTVYKAISPYGALRELQVSDRYDGIVFLRNNEEQEFFGRATFNELMARLPEKGKAEVRLKE